MGLYKAAKRHVPLKWKERYHSLRTVPNDVGVRFRNRLNGGLPVPPGRLIYLVAGHVRAEWFLRGGRTASEAIRETLEKNGIEIEGLDDILDFGCGVGRIMRHWSSLRHPALHGTDYNPKLVAWCKSNLTFAEFRVNPLSGELPYEPDSFDFVYAFSVFTHLSEELQFHWLDELSRVLRPGGYAYITTHGDYYLNDLSAEQQEQYRSGRLVVRWPEQSGENVCSAFHPESYVREKWAEVFSVVDFIPSGAKGDSEHDVYLVRKPARA
jgi:SAM-dependent methyltransferase